MKFPSTSTRTLAKTLEIITEVATGIKRETAQLRQQAAGDTTTVARILLYVARLRSSKSQLQELAATPGIEAYATAQYGQDAGIAESYAALMTEIDDTITWIATNLPKDANGYLQAAQIAADGAVTERTFPASVLAGLRTQLDALTDTIE